MPNCMVQNLLAQRICLMIDVVMEEDICSLAQPVWGGGWLDVGCAAGEGSATRLVVLPLRPRRSVTAACCTA